MTDREFAQQIFLIFLSQDYAPSSAAYTAKRAVESFNHRFPQEDDEADS